MPRNLVFICLDSVRLDYFNKYASRLRDLADIDFSECRAASSWSVPSYGSLMTGDLPSIHGSHAFNESYNHLSQSDTFLSEFPECVSLGLSANPYASPDFGFDDLFDSFIPTRPGKYNPDGMSVDSFGWDYDESGLQLYLAFVHEALNHENTGASLANAIIQKSRNILEIGPIPRIFDDGAKSISRRIARELKQAEQPIFIFASLMESHEPMDDTFGYNRDLYDAPWGWSSGKIDEINTEKLSETFISRYRDVYSAAIGYLDRTLSQMVESVIHHGNTTVIITSDHGENLGYEADGGIFGHVGSMSEGLLHVPLLIFNPPRCAPNGTIDKYISHIDLPNLFVALANDGWIDITKKTIVSERVGGSQWLNDYSSEGRDEFWDRTIRAAYRENTKIEWDSLGNVYRTGLNDSPSSRVSRDLIDVPPTWASKHFNDHINALRESAIEAGKEMKVSGDVKERLEKLGYR